MNFRIELPSWGFANTGTRFGKFIQPGAAVTIEEKLSDAQQVNAVTGCCPTLAVHVLWDFPNGIRDVESVKRAAERSADRHRRNQPEHLSGSDLQTRIAWEPRSRCPASRTRSSGRIR